jgi:hypothetical protein
MTPSDLATELAIDPKALRAWVRRTYPRDAAEHGTRHDLSPAVVAAARQHWGGSRPASTGAMQVRTAPAGRAAGRDNSDEAYVLDLLDAILGASAQRQHRFPWLLGDPDANGSRVALPVDGYWPDLRLVVEYRERQHDEATPFFDKPDRLTVSGVHRGEQRRLYDKRRDDEIPKHGLTLLIVKPRDLAADARGRLVREPGRDEDALRELLRAAEVPTT